LLQYIVSSQIIWFWCVDLNMLQRTRYRPFALLCFFRFNTYGAIRKAQQVLSLAFLVCGLHRTISNIVVAIRAWRIRGLPPTDCQESLAASFHEDLSRFVSGGTISAVSRGTILVSLSFWILCETRCRYAIGLCVGVPTQ
jgi:hypothetical protein